MSSPILPDDSLNRELMELVAPEGWENPTPLDRYDLIVVGGGTAGIIAALGAAGLGASVALIEKHMMGGDCLNWGCVPSKAIIRSAHAAHEARRAADFGVVVGEVSVDFGAVMERMRSIRTGIAHHDSFARMKREGVHTFRGHARFTGRREVEVAGQKLRFHRAVLATGARAWLPPIDGLDTVSPLTNETLFQLTELPERLLVIGGGPIGVEMAQAFRRLGSEVMVVDREDRLLPREDPDAGAVLAEAFEAEGIATCLGATVARFECSEDTSEKRVFINWGADEHLDLAFDEVLVATGRRANLEGLGLEAAGVHLDERGRLRVDDMLRTTNPRVYASGDVAGHFQLTHAADATSRIVVQNALFFGSKSVHELVVPRCTYTDPEVAQVGLSHTEAEEREDITTWTAELREVDRARLDGQTAGFVKLHVDRGGHLVGGTLVGRHAGEHLGELALAVTNGLSVGQLEGTMHAYPTQAEVMRRAAGAWSKSRLTPLAKTLLGGVIKLRRL